MLKNRCNNSLRDFCPCIFFVADEITDDVTVKEDMKKIKSPATMASATEGKMLILANTSKDFHFNVIYWTYIYARCLQNNV
jgi:hypothetical protein